MERQGCVCWNRGLGVDKGDGGGLVDGKVQIASTRDKPDAETPHVWWRLREGGLMRGRLQSALCVCSLQPAA